MSDDDPDLTLDPFERAISFAIREATRIQREADAAASGLMNVRQAAAYLATSTTTLRTLARAGTIRSAAIGDGLRFRRSWLDEWIDAGGGKIEQTRSVAPAATHGVHEVVTAIRTAAAAGRTGRARAASPKKPSGPVPAARTDDGKSIYLLRQEPPYRTGIAHYGFDPKGPLCRRKTDKPLKVVSVETTWLGRDNANCRPCLNEAGRTLGPRVVDLGLDHVTMRTVTRHGESVSVRNEGWHIGNGRATWCGKTRDEWDLAFRSPGGGASRCVDCHEREIYLRERRKGDPYETIYVSDPLYCRAVLLDSQADADTFIGLVKRAPGVFDVRRASASLEVPAEDELDPFCEPYRGAVHVAGIKRPVERWCGLSLIVSATLPATVPFVKDVEAAAAFAKPLVSRAERRASLRARWDRESKAHDR